MFALAQNSRIFPVFNQELAIIPLGKITDSHSRRRGVRFGGHFIAVMMEASGKATK